MSERGPIGSRLDALGVGARLDGEELVDGAVVVMRVIDTDGQARVASAWSEGMDFIVRRGLLEIALDADRIPPQDEED